MSSAGCYVIYRLGDGFVLRAGLCEPGTEAQQVLNPAVEGLLVHDRGMLLPDDWRVTDGQLIHTPRPAAVVPAFVASEK